MEPYENGQGTWQNQQDPPYNGQQYGGWQNQQTPSYENQYGGQQYGGQYGNEQYGNQQYGGQYGNEQYGNEQYGNRQFERRVDPGISAAHRAYKEIGGSWPYVVQAIAITIMAAVVSIVAFYALANFSRINDSLTVSIFGSSYSAIEELSSVSMFVKLVGFDILAVLIGVPVTYILLTIGHWVSFADCRSKMRPEGKGLGLLKVSLWIEFGLVIVQVVVFGYLFIQAIRSIRSLESMYGLGTLVSEISEYEQQKTTMYIVMAIFFIAMILMLLYFAKSISCLKAAQEICSQGYPSRKLSMYVVVMNILTLVFYVIGLFGSVSHLDLDVTSLIALFVVFAPIVISTILILQLRSRLIAGN